MVRPAQDRALPRCPARLRDHQAARSPLRGTESGHHGQGRLGPFGPRSAELRYMCAWRARIATEAGVRAAEVSSAKIAALSDRTSNVAFRASIGHLQLLRSRLVFFDRGNWRTGLFEADLSAQLAAERQQLIVATARWNVQRALRRKTRMRRRTRAGQAVVIGIQLPRVQPRSINDAGTRAHAWRGMRASPPSGHPLRTWPGRAVARARGLPPGSPLARD